MQRRSWSLALPAGLALLATVDSAEAQRRFTTEHRCTDTQRAAGCVIVLGSGMPVPDPERAGPAYAVVYGDRTFIVDAGAGVMRRAAQAGLPIDGFTRMFITHLHSDHTLGLPDAMLTTWVMGRRTSMVLHGPPGLREMTDHLLAAWRADIRVRTDGLERGQRDGERVDVRESRGGVVYDSAGVRVTAIPVPHGDWDVALGYLFELPGRKIVFSGDAAPSATLEEASRGADVLVHEVYPAVRLKPEARPGGEEWPRYMRSVHTSDEEIGALAARAQVRHVVLSHVIWMGGTAQELLDGVRRGGYRGVATVARDLDAY